LFAAAQCLLSPGDEALLIAPHYVTYPATLRAAGATVVAVASDPDHAFALDIGRLEASVTGRTRLLLLNSPNNPTGAVYPVEVLERIATLVIEHDLWLIWDEVYAPFAYDQPFVSPRSLAGMAERTVAVNSLSKSHAMTGWRLGWAIAPETLIDRMSDLALVMHYGLPGFIQDAALVALANEGAQADIVGRYRRRRDLFIEALREQGFDAASPAGGMNVMLDLRDLGRPSEDLAWQLLEDERVAVLPGDGFGSVAAGFVRASFCTSEDRLGEAARRIGRFVRRLRSRRSTTL
jgi:arginine:pyruvate transaminase